MNTEIGVFLGAGKTSRAEEGVTTRIPWYRSLLRPVQSLYKLTDIFAIVACPTVFFWQLRINIIFRLRMQKRSDYIHLIDILMVNGMAGNANSMQTAANLATGAKVSLYSMPFPL